MFRGVLMLGAMAAIVGGLAVVKFSPEAVEGLIPDDADIPSITPVSVDTAREAIRRVGDATMSEERRAQIAADLDDPDKAAAAFARMNPLERLVEADRVLREAKASFEQNGVDTSDVAAAYDDGRLGLAIVSLIEASPDKQYLSAKLTEWSSAGVTMAEILARLEAHEAARTGAAAK